VQDAEDTGYGNYPVTDDVLTGFSEVLLLEGQEFL